jgi:hypothetical protein
MSHTITEEMWPILRPGEVKVTPIDDGSEVLFSVGRRRSTRHVVLNEAEALTAWTALGAHFGFDKRTKPRSVSRRAG